MAREKGPAEIPMIMYEPRPERHRPAPSAPAYCSPEGKRGEREAFGRGSLLVLLQQARTAGLGSVTTPAHEDSALPGQEGFRRRLRRHLTRVGKSVGSPNRDVT